MNDKMTKRASKMMSLILRHNPDYINSKLDANGWILIEELITGINKKGLNLNKGLLEIIVAENDKKRFMISPNGLKIRANQGHSIPVDLELAASTPPEFLYHGTVAKFMIEIQKEGLKKMKRQHVHMSQDIETAITVGSRRGKPIILTVKAGEMHRKGTQFYLSENGVWLTDRVLSQYIELK